MYTHNYHVFIIRFLVILLHVLRPTVMGQVNPKLEHVLRLPNNINSTIFLFLMNIKLILRYILIYKLVLIDCYLWCGVSFNIFDCMLLFYHTCQLRYQSW